MIMEVHDPHPDHDPRPDQIVQDHSYLLGCREDVQEQIKGLERLIQASERSKAELRQTLQDINSSIAKIDIDYGTD